MRTVGLACSALLVISAVGVPEPGTLGSVSANGRQTARKGRPANPGEQGLAQAVARGAAPPAGYRMPDAPWKNRLDKLPQTPEAARKLTNESRPPDGSEGNCYPAGHEGYHPDCINPNFTSSRINLMKYHWPDLDPENTAPADPTVVDVYVVDELEGTRASEWLQWVVNDLNTNWGGPSRPWRPTIYYMSSNAMKASRINQMYGIYNVFTNCGANWDIHVEFCQRTDVPRWAGSVTDYWVYTNRTGWAGRAGHALMADSKITSTNVEVVDGYNIIDPDIQYHVLHELGHSVLGLAHTDECASVMTFCRQYDGQYMSYSPTDYWVMSTLYDGHWHQ